VAALVALAALLAAGVAGHGAPALRGGRAPLPSLLPSVDLSASAAAVWSCPGPLPLSAHSTASISIANPTRRAASASVLIAETAYTPPQLGGHALGSRTVHVAVPASSELSIPVVAMPVRVAHGLVLEAAVAVTVTGAGVAVSEATSSPSGRFQQPCASGVSSRGYLAEGMTAGSSDVRVSVFNPRATAAVVDVAVGTESGTVNPAALQGIVVPAEGLSLIDLARYVPQRTRVAVSVLARVGRVAVGEWWHGSARFSTKVRGAVHHYTEQASGLAVGIGRALSQWSFATGATGLRQTPAVRIFNPGSRAARVAIRSTIAGGRAATLQLSVPAGSVAVATAPVAQLPKPSVASRRARAHGAARARGRSAPHPAPSPTPAPVLSVTDTNGTGIVVERETYRSSPTSALVVVTCLEPVPGAATGYVLPGLSLARSDRALVVITNGGSRTATVTLRPLSPGRVVGSAPSVARRIGAGSSVSLPLSSLVAGSTGEVGLVVTSTSPVFVGVVSSSSASNAPGVPLVGSP
jgi:hypothetical protein